MKIKIFICILIVAFISGLALSVDLISAEDSSEPKEMDLEKINKDYTVYEAEEGETVESKIQDNHEGYSGEGFVNLDAKEGAVLTIKVNVKNKKEYKVLMRYALKSNTRDLDISVNGKVIYEPYTFNNTGAWSEFRVIEIKMKLKKGDNKIEFTTVGQDGPNIDLIGIKK